MKHFIKSSRFERYSCVWACRWICLAIALTLGAPDTARAFHPLHESLTEIRRNPQTGSLEVTMCLWAADLEDQIKSKTGEPVDLAAKDAPKKFDKMVRAFVEKHFSVLQNSVPTQSRWIGYEIENHRIWIYFEIKNCATAESWTVKHTSFHQLNENQSNAIIFRDDERSTTVYCLPNQPAQTITPGDLQPLRGLQSQFQPSTTN